MNEHVLDNPAWNALNSEHAGFAMGSARAKRYRPGTVPFVACRNPQAEGIVELMPWMAAGETFFAIGVLPPLPQHWQLEHELPCAQMLLKKIQPPSKKHEPVTIELLGENDADDMYTLINLVQPGYYNKDTHQLGTYYGIRQNGVLAAMAGERMRTTGFSELSAIATHPDYTGRGYAQRLIEHLCHAHAAKGIASYLHVALTNERALRLYEHMGFETRREISFYKIRHLG